MLVVPKLASGAWSSFTVELLSSVEALTHSGTDSRKHRSQTLMASVKILYGRVTCLLWLVSLGAPSGEILVCRTWFQPHGSPPYLIGKRENGLHNTGE